MNQGAAGEWTRVGGLELEPEFIGFFKAGSGTFTSRGFEISARGKDNQPNKRDPCWNPDTV